MIPAQLPADLTIGIYSIPYKDITCIKFDSGNNPSLTIYNHLFESHEFRYPESKLIEDEETRISNELEPVQWKFFSNDTHTYAINLFKLIFACHLQSNDAPAIELNFYSAKLICKVPPAKILLVFEELAQDFKQSETHFYNEEIPMSVFRLTNETDRYAIGLRHIAIIDMPIKKHKIIVHIPANPEPPIQYPFGDDDRFLETYASKIRSLLDHRWIVLNQKEQKGYPPRTIACNLAKFKHLQLLEDHSAFILSGDGITFTFDATLFPLEEIPSRFEEVYNIAYPVKDTRKKARKTNVD